MKERIYHFFQYQDSSLPLNISFTGISYCDNTYRIERSRSTIYSFEYICRGKGTLEIDDEVFHPAENDVYILNKGSRHCYYSDEEDPWEKYWVVFYGPFADFLFQEYIPPRTWLVHDCNLLPLMQRLLRAAEACANNYRGLTDQAAPLLLEMAVCIRNRVQNRPPDLAEKTRRWLDAHMEGVVRLADLSREMNYSVNHLIQTFRGRYGITPYAYCQLRKTEIACKYLTDTTLSIGEIADKLCFADAHYFSGVFRKRTGVSPGRYRRQALQADSAENVRKEGGFP